jgi:hypothetical protein
MTCIELNIEIAAERQVCFDLSRSIDLHQHTTKETNEKAINGRLKGLINEGEWVKWRATHFGISQTMTHLHTFKTSNEKTVMTDVFEYEVPYGLFGKIFDRYILKPHMTKLLEQRNRIIKEVAESGQWKNFINHA